MSRTRITPTFVACWLAQTAQTKKERYCRLDRLRDSTYCGSHCHLGKPSAGNKAPRERVPCPVDPTHTVYAIVHHPSCDTPRGTHKATTCAARFTKHRYKDRLTKHLLVCNASRNHATSIMQPFYKPDCNLGPASGDSAGSAARVELKDMVM